MNSLIENIVEANQRPAFIIDMHAHLGGLNSLHMPGSQPASMVEQMDRLGIEFMLCSHFACITTDVVYGNNELLSAMKDFPGRILGYAATYPINAALGIDEVKRCMDNGMRGIKLHSHNNIPYNSDAYLEIWEYADKNCLPVLLHTWCGNMDEYEQIFKNYRNARIILAHTGSGRPEKYVEFARKYENVFLDICCSNCLYRLIEYLALELGADRILFGSDIPFYSPAPQLGKVLFADISEQDKEKILRLNALGIMENH